MVKAAKKTTTKKPATKASSTRAKVDKTKRTTRPAKAVVSNKVDYYPNRMTVAVSALAGTLLVLFSLIAVLGYQ
jgi:hypothetical protein